MSFTKTISLLATAGALALPAAASADTLVTAAPGAQNLASGGGYLAWAAPAPDGGFQLAVRSPDGTVTTPQVPAFRVAPDPVIGSAITSEGRSLVALYARDGDIFSLNLRTGAERRVNGASSSRYEEYAPGIEFGRVAFVRRGGSDNGVFTLTNGRLRKVTSARPRELAFNGSRVAYPSGANVVIRRTSGKGAVSTVKTSTPAFGLVLTRYSLTYLTRGGGLFQTPRFGGSSRVDRVTRSIAATRRLPASTNSVANQGSFVRLYLDAEGVKRISEQHIIPRS